MRLQRELSPEAIRVPLLHTSPFPLSMKQGKGSVVWDEDGHKYETGIETGSINMAVVTTRHLLSVYRFWSASSQLVSLATRIRWFERQSFYI